MKDQDDVRDHLNKFTDTVDKLTEMDVMINEDLLSIMMLYSLPHSFENFRIAIESRDELPSPDNLKIKIIEESEARNKSKPSTTEGAFLSKNNKGHFSRHNNFTNKSQNKSDFKPKCTRCFRFGHVAKNCRSKNSKTNEATFKTEQCLSSSLESTNKYSWCTSHMCAVKSNFHELKENSDEGTLKIASTDGFANIKGSGCVKLDTNKNNYSAVNLTDTLYLPSLNTNLMSVGKITDKGFNITFKKNDAVITDKKGNVVLKALRSENGLYYVETNKSKNVHESSCIQGKFSRLPFPTRESPKNIELLHTVHSDVCGPFRVQSPGGARYFVTFIDEHSRYTKVYFMKQKNEVFELFKTFKNEVENSTGKRIKYFQSDNGRVEYCNVEFDKYLKKCGIQRKLSAPRTPQQNGLAERKNRSLLDKARCLLLEAKLPQMFWAEAINTANYLLNRSPSRSLNGETPFQRWLGHTPSVRHLHIFGAKAFVLNKNPNKGKLASKTEEGIFMGYSDISKAFRIWMPHPQKVIISRDVKVINSFDHGYSASNDDHESLLEESLATNNSDDHFIILPSSTSSVRPVQNVRDEKNSEEEESKSDEEQTTSRQERNRRPPNWTYDYDMSYFCNEEDAYQIETSEEWHEAIKNEIKSHVKNETWILVNKEEGKKTIGCKMVLKNKLNSDGSLERKKVRLVARGFAQRPNIDFIKTFAPVAKLSSIRLLLGIAAEEQLKISQLDVSTAYLNGDIEEEIYMEKPPCLEKFLYEIILEESCNEDKELFKKSKRMLEDLRKGNSEKVCLLKRALYGLKQAGRQWYKKLDVTLKELGFQSSAADPYMYISVKGGDKVIIAVYVDDILIASSNEEMSESIKEKLMRSFEMRDLGDLKYCLGIEFTRHQNGFSVNQRKYIEELLEKFNIKDCPDVKTPMQPGLKLEKARAEDHKELPYQNLIGSLMYLSVATRPDISFAVSYLSQFNSYFGNEHWTAAKHVLRYLQGTKDFCLKYEKTGKPIIGLTDADWAACSIDFRSYTGFCFLYAGGPVSWESKKQRTVALSTAEAEYMAFTEAAKEAIHLKQLANDMGIFQDKIIIFNDNQAA